MSVGSSTGETSESPARLIFFGSSRELRSDFSVRALDLGLGIEKSCSVPENSGLRDLGGWIGALLQVFVYTR